MNWKFLKRKHKSNVIVEEDGRIEGEYVFKSKDLFPCSSDNCLVRVACTVSCDKIIFDDDELKAAFLKHNACPDCGSGSFMEGPSGGMSTNVKCNGCSHWFNLGLPLFIQRIHIDTYGRFLD